MPKYLLSVHTGDSMPTSMSEEDTRHGFERVEHVEDELRAAGALVFGGRLHDPDRSRVVRPAKRRVHATDGPYAESKEWLGGFYIIDAADDANALDWASKVTLAVDTPIEIRPFAGETRLR
jgi:hypothetical protein